MAVREIYAARTTLVQPRGNRCVGVVASTASCRRVFVAVAIAFQLSAAVPSTPAEVPRGIDALVARARAARIQQDSMLAAYETKARQRISFSLGISAGLAGAQGLPLAVVGPPRLAGRMETVARVGWSQSTGAWAELLAARSVLPMFGNEPPQPETGEAALVLPFYPGRDWLWPTGELYRALPSARDWIVHPLSAGGDSVYDFSAGDSLDIRLPDQRTIHVREIRVRPHRPSARLIVGSLWVDASTGNMVRIVYRPSTPIDLWPIMQQNFDRDDRNKAAKFGPYIGTIREIIVDNGLYEGRFWLPRTRTASGEGTASGARVTFSMEQTFQYTSVTAMAPGVPRVAQTDTVHDVDPKTGRIREPTWYGVERKGTDCRQHGDTSSTWKSDSVRDSRAPSSMIADGVRFKVLVPCDSQDLVTSPELPASIFGPAEAVFPTTDFSALQRDAAEALGMDRQPQWSPQPYAWHYGLDRQMVRYNRVEGLSAGLLVEREYGRGFTGGALARIATQAPTPVGEVFARRSNVATDLQLGLYRRLAASNDWGNPLGPGASISALVFGRDDGFYYRTLGAEISGARRSRNDAFAVRWRVFGEQQSTARVETQGSLAHTINGSEFTPNIDAVAGNFYGGAGLLAYAHGDDPTGFRVSGSTRLETATGKQSYARGMSELTVSRGLLSNALFSITGAAGTSAGMLTTQRLWFLGGPYTVHGQPAGAAVGDAFWLGRAELSQGYPLVRPIVFADVGWAGARKTFAQSAHKISGAGIGASMLNGLIRLDVSRGIRPNGTWRADFYLEIR